MTFTTKDMIRLLALFSDFASDFRFITIGDNTYLIVYKGNIEFEFDVFEFFFDMGYYFKGVYGVRKFNGYKLVKREPIDYNKCGKKIYRHSIKNR